MRTVCLTLRDCPAEVHQALKDSAQINHRSLRGEAVSWLQEKAVSTKQEQLEEAELFRRINTIRWKTCLTAEEVDRAKKHGRK